MSGIPAATAPNAATVTPAPKPPAATPVGTGGRAQVGSFAMRLQNSPRPGSPLAIPATARPKPEVPVVAPVAPTPEVTTTPPVVVAPVPEPVADGPVIGRGGKEIPSQSVSDRVAREQRRLWREEYGTDDPIKVNAIKASRRAEAQEFVRLKNDKLEREREQMTREQQLNADLEAERQRNKELADQLNEMQTGQVVSSQTQQLTEIAARHITPKLVRYALADFQSYLTQLSPDDIKRTTPRSIERWFRKFADDNPEFKPAPVSATPETEPTPVATPPVVAKPPVRRVPIVTSTAPKGGAPTPKPQVSPDPSLVNGKTFLPGRPNSMTPQEVKAELRKKGRKAW